jgi:hypothetical protein
MLPLAHTAIGTIVAVALPEHGVREATVAARPFLDPGKTIPKS